MIELKCKNTACCNLDEWEPNGCSKFGDPKKECIDFAKPFCPNCGNTNSDLMDTWPDGLRCGKELDMGDEKILCYTKIVSNHGIN